MKAVVAVHVLLAYMIEVGFDDGVRRVVQMEPEFWGMGHGLSAAR